MTHYFIKEEDREFGPFSVEQLKSNRLTKETLVWRPGFAGWTPALQVLELREIFDSRYTGAQIAKNKIGKLLNSNFSRHREKKVS
ncbi:MAG: DUF4339 domain-containing protein [Bacteroidota bacterium]|nr:DUF4339 domain-containing protein [Bacteroidota bacterium]